MFFNRQPKDNKKQNSHSDDIYRAVMRNTAWIEFTPDGTVTNVSDLFLSVVGYTRDEVVGQHHRLFCASSLVGSPEYQAFWQQLGAGDTKQGVYERVRKDGQMLILDATYFPIKDDSGQVVGVAKIASDITALHSKDKDKRAVLNACN